MLHRPSAGGESSRATHYARRSATLEEGYTAANGDTLRSSITGTGHFLPDGGVSYTTTETFTGGTGRFADATGEVTDDGLAAFTSASGGTSTYTVRGSIAY